MQTDANAQPDSTPARYVVFVAELVVYAGPSVGRAHARFYTNRRKSIDKENWQAGLPVVLTRNGKVIKEHPAGVAPVAPS